MGAPEKTTGFILGPDGELAAIATIKFDAEDALLLRHYKRFLERHNLREALFCSACWTGNRNDHLQAFVTPNRIMFKCACTMRVFEGQTF